MTHGVLFRSNIIHSRTYLFFDSAMTSKQTVVTKTRKDRAVLMVTNIKTRLSVCFATTTHAAVLKTVQNKIDKYAKLVSTHMFCPVAVETAGTWHDMAIELTQKIGRRITTITENTGETTFFFLRISIAVQRGRKCCLLPVWSPNEIAIATISHLHSFNFHACGFVLVGQKQ